MVERRKTLFYPAGPAPGEAVDASRATPEMSLSNNRLKRLRNEIQSGTYIVNSAHVAEALLRDPTLMEVLSGSGYPDRKEEPSGKKQLSRAESGREDW